MHLDGLEVVLKLALHEKQTLVDPEGPLTSGEFFVNAFIMASLVLRMAKCLAFACSLNRTRIKWLTNHKGALEESGIKALPCT